jgi:hypothetical protein
MTNNEKTEKVDPGDSMRRLGGMEQGLCNGTYTGSNQQLVEYGDVNTVAIHEQR